MAIDGTALTDREIGDRLRIARQRAGITQAEAANSIDVARTTIVAIEHGRRRIRNEELQTLAVQYGSSANAVLRQEAVHLDLVPQFRKLAGIADELIEVAARLLTDLVSAEVELENVLGIDRYRNYPRQRPILSGDVCIQAEQDAQELRDWIGLGPGPVKDIASLAELEFGIRLYWHPLDSRISGLFAHDERIGACMLLNANHPHSRQAHTIAHELGHFITAREEPAIFTDDSIPGSRTEKYANCFARAFLTPARPLKQRFDELTAGQSHFTRRHVILLAWSFGVSRESIVRRLEELGVIRTGTWDWFEEQGGITNQQAADVLGQPTDASPSDAPIHGPVSPRLGLLVQEAWKKGFYSEGQLARMLRIHRVDVRMLFDHADLNSEYLESDELVKLSG